MNTAMTPARARASLEQPTADDVVALAQLWRETRSGDVANALEQMGRTFANQNPPAVPRGAGALHTLWLDVAEQGAIESLSWLADSLTKQLPKPAKQQRSNIELAKHGLAERLRALARLEADPRLAAAVAHALITCPFAFERPDEIRGLYGVAFDLLCSDVRQAAVLAAALETPHARAGITRAALRDLLPPLVARCKRVTQRLSAHDAAWRELIRPEERVAPRLDEAALLQRVLENEADDAARLVYADALSERGDARGEFIGLQLSPTRWSPVALKRQRALVKQHQRLWLGPLHHVFTHHVFHRGFLFEAALAHNAKVEQSVWREAQSHTELRFLRRLRQGRGSAATYLRFLDSEGCQGVTDLEIDDGLLGEVFRRPNRPWHSLALKHAPALEGLRALRALPKLRGLVVDFIDDVQLCENLRKSGLLEQLTWLEFRGTRLANEWVALIGVGALQRVTFTAFQSCLTVTRGADGFVVEGESEDRQFAQQVLEAVGSAERLALVLRDFDPAKNELVWFDQWVTRHAKQHQVKKETKTSGVRFHERLRLSLSRGVVIEGP